MKKKRVAFVFLIFILLVIGGLSFYKFSFGDSVKVTEDNIMKMALRYVTDNEGDIQWNKDVDVVSGNLEYSCVGLEELISVEDIDSSNLNHKNITNYVMVVRDDNENVISSRFVSDNVCRVDEQVKIPSSSDICNNISYDGEVHNLINRDKNHVGYSYVDRVESEALEYPVSLSLEEYYVWEDGTYEEKEVMCSIKKKGAILELSSYGNDNTVVGVNNIQLNSNVSGEVLVEVSNSNLVSVELGDSNIQAGISKNISINTISSSDEEVIVTFTVVPNSDYNQNYESTSVVYTVGKNLDKEVAVPSADEYCNNDLVYNQNLQVLTKEAGEGFSFLDNVGINAFEYKVTAILKYGYKWNDGTYEKKDIYCKISKKVPEVFIDDGVEEIVKDEDEIIRVETEVTGNFLIGNDNIKLESNDLHSLGYYNFNRLHLKGIEVSDNNDVMVKFIPGDIKNYEEVQTNINLSVINNEFNLNYNLNGGSGCEAGSKKIYYGREYGELCMPTREGYEFIGWYDDSVSRDNLISEEIILDDFKDVNIYAHFKKDIKLSLIQYEGDELITDEITGEMYNDEGGAKLSLPSASNYFDSECGEWDNLGWSVLGVADGNIDYKADKEYEFSEDLTLYAKYVKKVTFNYNVNGGNAIKPRYEYMYKSASGDASNLGSWVEEVNTIPVKSGYEFLGWYNAYDLEIGASAIEKGDSALIDFGCNGYEVIAKWVKES